MLAASDTSSENQLMTVRFLTPTAAMQHALALAERGLGSVEPNPAVGAVIVDDDLNLLGAGYHQRFGGPHAEVHAIADAGERARGATLYVTLEPCAHYGKTPPCADAVIAAGLKRVIIAMRDPAPHTAGRGVEKLRQAGIEVEVGLLETDAMRLTAPFVTLITQRRPYVHAKWAMTLDGRMASRTGHSQWISNEKSRAVVHTLRGRMDGILVGVGTVLADDPQLTARPRGPRVAARIVLDSRGRTPIDCALTRDTSVYRTLIATTEASPTDWRAALTERGVEVLPLPTASGTGRVDLAALLAELGRRQLTNLLVEGGSETHGEFFDAGLMDEFHVFIAPRIVGGREAIGPVGGRGLAEIPECSTVLQQEVLDGDLYIRGVRCDTCSLHLDRHSAP